MKLNTYEIIFCTDSMHSVIAETASKAKYKIFLEYADCFNCDFGEFVKKVITSCRKIGNFKVNDLYGDEEQFERMKEWRDIPFAYIGMKVEVHGKMGTIVGSNSASNLDICFDAEFWANNCHPGCGTRYFDDAGKVLMDCTKPDASKCIECRFLERCKRLLGRTEKSVGCDFSPTKFLPKEALR